MNPYTLTFKDKQLEEKFNHEYESARIVKFTQILMAMMITNILCIYFWMKKNAIYIALMPSIGLVCCLVLYYYLVCKKKFIKYIPLIIASFSASISLYQIIITIIHVDVSEQELVQFNDIVMLLVFVLQIQTNFLLNTCQYLSFIIFRIYIRISVDFNVISILLFVYSVIIIYHDYKRIKNSRNKFLLQEYNNNQLRMLENLEQPILVFEFEEKSSRLLEHFVNKAFINKIKNNSIDFVKNCLIDKKNNLYTVILSSILQVGISQQLYVQYEKQQYKVSSENYIGSKLLVALEFTEIKQRNVQSNPYFYCSIMKYLYKNNQAQYKREIWKNLCGYLLYRPNKLQLGVQLIKIKTIIQLVNAYVVEYGNDINSFKSNTQLLELFFYLFRRCFQIRQLSITKLEQDDQIYYEIIIFGKLCYFTDNMMKLNVLKSIIRILGLDDLTFTMNSCRFTLIDLQERFISI